MSEVGHILSRRWEIGSHFLKSELFILIPMIQDHMTYTGLDIRLLTEIKKQRSMKACVKVVVHKGWCIR